MGKCACTTKNSNKRYSRKEPHLKVNEERNVKKEKWVQNYGGK